MSYDKTTINNSSIDLVSKVLRTLGVNHQVHVLRTVEGKGVLDYIKPNRRIKYDLKYLTSGGEYILIDQMQRTEDCDSDDTIVTLVCDKDFRIFHHISEIVL